jgi:predicted  nucleic acid-binding Zn-ribbon protein
MDRPLSFIELKSHLLVMFSTFSADQFLYREQWIRDLGEKVGLPPDWNIEEWIVSSYPLVQEYREFLVRKRNDMERDIADPTKKFQEIESKILTLQNDVNDSEKSLRELVESEPNLQAQMKGIQKEIEDLATLPEKPPYTTQRKKLKKDLKQIEQSISELPEKSEMLKEKVGTDKKKVAELRQLLTSSEGDLRELKKQFTALKSELESPGGAFNENEEKGALDWLAEVLLKKKIEINTPSSYDSYSSNRNKVQIKFNHSQDSKLRDEVFTELEIQFNSKPPQDWRAILAKVFLSPMPTSGTIVLDGTKDWLGPKFGEYHDDIFDYVPLQAIWTSLSGALFRNSSSIGMFDEVILPIGGGIFAEIYFRELPPKDNESPRERGHLKNDPEVYLFAKERLHILTHSVTLFTGYSDMQIKIPIGTYIVLDSYAIEIFFQASSLLLGSSTAITMANALANAEGEQLADEEQRQRDYWDD